MMELGKDSQEVFHRPLRRFSKKDHHRISAHHRISLRLHGVSVHKNLLGPT
jgi:hypothetical protein